MAIPIFYLFVYLILDFVLNRMSQIARKFLWANSDNARGILLVNWSTVTISKTKGGMGVRNMSAVKHSLMAKNLFNYLNKKNSIWVDILYMKYGNHNFWTHQCPSDCSDFFKGLSLTAILIKPNLWINCVNPSTNYVLYHPWMFDVAIAFKPVHLSMNLDIDHCQISDFMINSSWNRHALDMLFGTG